MIHKAIKHLEQIRCTQYTGENAEALRELDLVELENLLIATREQEANATQWADGVKSDVIELEAKLIEHETIRDVLSEIRTAGANVRRHFNEDE